MNMAELLKNYSFDLLRLDYAADRQGDEMSLDEYKAEEDRITDEYIQAIVNELGTGTCKIIGIFLHGMYDRVEFSCGHSVKWVGLELPKFCPSCGRKVVKP